MVEQIPLELRQAPQWVVAREDAVPLNVVTRKAADPTNPLSWTGFEQAVATGLPHLGFCLSHGDPYTIIDLDDKVTKPATDEQRAFFAQLIQAFGSYTEVSRSGRGYHIVVRGRIPAGRRCDKKRIEVYTADRYFIMTGNVIPGYTTIVDGQKGLDWLLSNILDSNIPGQSSLELDTCEAQPDTDQEMLNKMCNATNAEKIVGLWQGNWQQYGYPSQSEADMALVDILCYYSPNDAQVRRMFRYSALGQRDKAQRDQYLNYMLRKKRVEQLPVDYTMLLPILPPAPAPAQETQVQVVTDEADQYQFPESQEDEVVRTTTQGQVVETFAPGAVGWLQWYSYCSAERPALPISLVGSIGYLAGLCGRSFNLGGMGLNQYLLLLAPTGTGKDELAKLQERLIKQTADMIPSIKDFRGPGSFASGQAIIKQLCRQPCFSAVLSEFGHTIKDITDTKASAANEMIRKVLLLVYGASGAEGTLQPMAYSDAEKTTKEVKSPALTLIGETVAESFYAAMSNEQVENGLLPRFITFDYRGARPAANPNSGAPLPTEMRNWLVELASICLTQGQRGTAIDIAYDTGVEAFVGRRGQFDSWIDELMRNATNEVERQLWNRAHLKAIKLAGLVAAATNPHKPIVTMEYATWATQLVTKDTQAMIGRFAEGVGEGDAKQLSDLRNALWQYKDMNPQRLSDSYRIPEAVGRSGLVPFSFLQRKLANVTSFRKDRRGSTAAINAAIGTLVATGEIAEAPREKCLAIGYSGKLYIANFG